mgnify:CR=1 FL=1
MIIRIPFLAIIFLMLTTRSDECTKNFNSVKITYRTDCQNFLTIDKLRSNYNPFQFANLNPISFIDRNGNQPIAYVPENESELNMVFRKKEYRKVFKWLTKLTNDRLSFDYNSIDGHYQASIRRLADASKITKSGTYLLRDIINSNHRVILNYANYKYFSPNLRINQTHMRFLDENDASIINIAYNSDIRPLGNVLYQNPFTGNTFVSNEIEHFPAEIRLYHELVHVRQNMEHTDCLNLDYWNSEVLHTNSQEANNPFGSERIPTSELQAVGLTAQPSNLMDEADWSLRYSENRMRYEMGLPLRLRYLIH